MHRWLPACKPTARASTEADGWPTPRALVRGSGQAADRLWAGCSFLGTCVLAVWPSKPSCCMERGRPRQGRTALPPLRPLTPPCRLVGRHGPRQPAQTRSRFSPSLQASSASLASPVDHFCTPPPHHHHTHTHPHPPHPTHTHTIRPAHGRLERAGAPAGAGGRLPGERGGGAGFFIKAGAGGRDERLLPPQL